MGFGEVGLSTTLLAYSLSLHRTTHLMYCKACIRNADLLTFASRNGEGRERNVTGERCHRLFDMMITEIPHNMEMGYFLQDRDSEGDGVHMVIEGERSKEICLNHNHVLKN